MHTLEILREGWPVLSILLACSVLSVTIMIERGIMLRGAKLDTHRFLASAVDILRGEGRERAVAYCEQFPQPLAVVVRRVLQSDGSVTMRERAYRHVLRAEAQRMKRWVPILGTVASIAPFIGLLGTVVGIIKAFGSIATNAGGGPEVVAGGIAEALVTTAAGLVVAIPALVGFNYFQTKIKELVEDVNLAAHEVLDIVMNMEGHP